MKILAIMMSSLLDQQIGTGPLFTSGGEKRLFEMIRQFVRDGNEVTVLTSDAGMAVLQDEGIQAKIVTMPNTPFDRNDISQIGTILTYLTRILFSFALRKRLQGNFQIITTATGLLPDAWSTFALSTRYKGAKCFVHVHHISDTLRPSSWLTFSSGFRSGFLRQLSLIQQSVALKLVGRCGFTVFAFPPMVSSISRRGVPLHHIKTMENGVDLSLIGTTKATTSIDGIFIGRVSSKKGIYDLITIWQNVCKEVPNANLAIVGPIEDPFVHDAIRNKGLDKNILLTGRVPERRKFELLKSSKVFLFPSLEEGWGIAVSEALACGVPVIAYNLDAYQYAADSIVRIDQSDTTTFAQVVSRLLSNDSLREALGRKGFQYVKDWEQVAREELGKMVEEMSSTNHGVSGL